MSTESEIARGRRAELLLEPGSMVQEALENLELRLLNAFKQCSIEDERGIMAIKRQLKTIDSIQSYLEKIASDGKIAESDLNLNEFDEAS